MYEFNAGSKPRISSVLSVCEERWRSWRSSVWSLVFQTNHRVLAPKNNEALLQSNNHLASPSGPLVSKICFPPSLSATATASSVPAIALLHLARLIGGGKFHHDENTCNGLCLFSGVLAR